MRSAALALSLLLTGTTLPAHAVPAGALDVFLAGPADRPLAVDPVALGVRVAHVEERLGVPTFVFADAARFPAHGGSPEEAARQHLQGLASLYRLAPSVIETIALAGVHDLGEGAVIASFRAEVDGVEIFRHEIDVVMNQALGLVAVSGYLPPSDLAVQGAFAMRSEEAVARAFHDLTGVELSAKLLLPDEGEGAYVHYELAPAVEGVLGWQLLTPARAKAVHFMRPAGLVPAWYVELEVDGGDAAPYMSYVIDAERGEILFRNDLTAHAFTWRVHADAAGPWDGPQGNDAAPHPTGVPDGFAPVLLQPMDVTLANFPFSRNDPWLLPTATETRGNNVDAYADLFAPSGFQPGFDRRASVTAPGAFLAGYDHSLAPQANPQQTDASIANLFYVTNYLHDWFYDAGFDERAGNAQTTNYGRGGLQGDAMRAEAQDYGGRNNANMSTPADGAPPRMQVYLWDGVPGIVVQAPAALAGAAESNRGLGATEFDVTAEVVVPDPGGISLGCQPFGTSLAGRIVLLDRGACPFTDKANHAQNAGAIGVIIANDVPGAANALGGDLGWLTIPVVPTRQDVGAAWKSQVLANPSEPIVVRLRGGAVRSRDGALDNTLIAHEWGHYISNRLIGDSNGLTNPQGRALGEGWGDFHALLLMVRAEDVNLPGNNNWQGGYSTAAYASGASSQNASYYGSRRMPYSTDMQKNGLRLEAMAVGARLPLHLHPMASADALQNSQVHHAGEVWATMLWEVYVSLLRAHPFQEAQDRMKRYLVAAYKTTPVMPTFLEARDALLAVSAASDPADHVRFAGAFAWRGAGAGAKVADRASMDFIGAVNSGSVSENFSVVEATLDDSYLSCDADGILDDGEIGELRVTLLNDGYKTIPPGTARFGARSSYIGVQFPFGDTASVPQLAPNQRATFSVYVALLPGTPFVPLASFSLEIDFHTVSLPGIPLHRDEGGGNSAVDEMTGAARDWTIEGSAWSWSAEGSGRAHADNVAVAADHSLVTPWIAVGSTDFSLELTHSWSFETENGRSPYYDGGVIEYSLDGITWRDPYDDFGVHAGYGGYIAAGGGNPLEDRRAFGGTNPDFPASSQGSLHFGTMLAGQVVKFRFRVGTDASVGAYGWDINRVAVTGAANLPFGSAVPETSDGSSCNQVPIADAGPSQQVWEGGFDGSGAFQRATITLDGSASVDPEGAGLAFSWTQLAGAPVALASPSSAVTSFVADVPRDEVLSFALQVSDGVDSSLPRVVDVLVRNVNQSPVARVVAPAAVTERSVVRVVLDGSRSSDPDGEALAFSWRQVAGVPVVVADATAAVTSFDLPEVAQDETVRFGLVVSDGIDASAEALVDVLVINADRAPTVDAGADVTVASRGEVVLQAAGVDPDGETVSYAWTQVAGPAVALSGAGEVASFVAPSVAAPVELEFEVAASAGGGVVRDSVIVTVLAETLPVVDAGPDVQVAGRSVVVLRGDVVVPGGGPGVVVWTQLQGTPVVLTGGASAVASFVAPDVKVGETLVFQLEATAFGVSASDVVAVEVGADGAPVVDAGADVAAASRAMVQLRAVGSDPEGDALSFAWTQTAGPAVELVRAGSDLVSFVAPSVVEEAVLVFEVVASANGLVAADEVQVVVAAEVAPVADAGADVDVEARAGVVLRGTVEAGAVVSWRQVSGEVVVLEGASTLEASFVAPDVREMVELGFELVATARGVTGEADVVVVRVHPVNRRPVVAGPNEIVEDERTPVTLEAVGLDEDGDVLTFAWTQTGGPAVEMSGAGTAAVSFVTPEVAEDTRLSFRLVAEDAAGEASEAVVVTVLVRDVNRAPEAFAEVVSGGEAGSTVVLDASGSSDPDGDGLSFGWVQVEGAAVELSGADRAVATFLVAQAAEAQTLVFEVRVSDAGGLSDVARVSVEIAAEPAPVKKKAKGEGGCSSAGGTPAGLLAFGPLALLLRRRRA